MNGKRITAIGVAVWCLMVIGSALAGETENGTVTINNLVWLKNAGCFPKSVLPYAAKDCEALKSGKCGLSDGSTSYDWRLPEKGDLMTAYSNSSFFTNVKLGYWSLTEDRENEYFVVFPAGSAWSYHETKNTGYNVWCVRDRK